MLVSSYWRNASATIEMAHFAASRDAAFSRSITSAMPVGEADKSERRSPSFLREDRF
jgi:hypothetical protein